MVSLKRAVIGCVHVKKTNFYKFWWDTELDMLKEDSIRTNTILVAAGKPRFWQVYEEKRRCKMHINKPINRKIMNIAVTLLMSFMKLLWKNSSSIFGHQSLRMSRRHVS